jgi:hypothetical protein
MSLYDEYKKECDVRRQALDQAVLDHEAAAALPIDGLTEKERRILSELTNVPRSTVSLANSAGVPPNAAVVILSRLHSLSKGFLVRKTNAIRTPKGWVSGTGWAKGLATRKGKNMVKKAREVAQSDQAIEARLKTQEAKEKSRAAKERARELKAQLREAELELAAYSRKEARSKSYVKQATEKQNTPFGWLLEKD